MTPHFVIEGAIWVVCMKIPTHVRIEGVDAGTPVQWDIDFGAVRGSVSEAELRFRLTVEWVPVIESGRCRIVVMAGEEAGWYP